MTARLSSAGIVSKMSGGLSAPVPEAVECIHHKSSRRLRKNGCRFDLAPQPLDLVLLRLNLPVAGEGLHGLCAELLHPLAQRS